jgi:FkbM family methyltransferase
MLALKSVAKSALAAVLPNDLRVLTGPARGARLRLDLRREGQYWLGNYDAWVFKYFPIADYLKPGQVAWDCGAYVGYYAACFRRLVGPTGQVYAFEASAANYGRLRVLPSNNSWPNVYIHHLAVGPEHTELSFVDNLGGACGPVGLSKDYGTQSVTTTVVRSCGVDELVYEMGVTAPHFIKFDLESAEEFALHNGCRVFTDHRPVLQVEVHNPTARDAFGRFLSEYGYHAWVFGDPSHRLRRNVVDNHDLTGDWHMFICLPVE